MEALFCCPFSFLHRPGEEEICVGGFEDHLELVVVYPSLGPVDSWLSCHEPGIAQNHFLQAQFSEEEPHLGPLLSSPDFKVGEEFNSTVFVWGSVYIVNFSGALESFEGDSQPPGVPFIDEVFGGS